MPAHDASVVLCVRNGRREIPRQLEALARQETALDWELVVVDNGSTDGTADAAAAYADRIPGLRIVPATEMASLAYARNVGAESATGRILAYCDADDRVHADWLDRLIRACPEDGVVGGALDYAALNTPESRFWRGYEALMTELPRFDAEHPFAVGANFAVPRQLYLGVGGCDPRLNAFEEVDLCWRVQDGGGQICFAANALVDYQLRADLRATIRQQLSYGRGEVAFYVKRRPAVQRQPVKEALVAYWALLRGVHSLVRGRALRGRWLALAAMRCGRLQGSVRQRTLYW